MAYLEADNVSFTATGTNAVEQNLSVNKLTTVVISADTTLTTTVPKVCASAYVIVITSGTTSRTVTFGTGFKTTGTLSTGTSADRRFVFHFISDGTNLVEVSRTASITY
jgi:ribosomal protein L7Ae-like RNA K-turn-binding protein